MMWQPIESAPRDGTRILIWNAFFACPEIAFYRDGHVWKGGPAFHPSAMPREWHHAASHWMPLPPAPSEAAE